MATKDAKVVFFAHHMQCIFAVKLIKFILNECIFREGGSCPENRLLPELRPGDRLLPKKPTFVLDFRPQFLALGKFFFGKLGGAKYYYYIAFYNIYDILQPEGFRDA